MRWPWNARVDVTHSWGTVAAGIAIYGIMVGAMVALHASNQRYRWWWPNYWLLIPVVITFIGAFLVVVPVRSVSEPEPVPEPVPGPEPAADIRVDQEGDELQQGGKVIGLQGNQGGRGVSISVKQRFGKVAGKMIGVKFGKGDGKDPDD
jgi:hypothetical protein